MTYHTMCIRLKLKNSFIMGNHEHYNHGYRDRSYKKRITIPDNVTIFRGTTRNGKTRKQQTL